MASRWKDYSGEYWSGLDWSGVFWSVLEEVLREAGTKSEADYIVLRQAAVVQCVSPRPLLEVCARKTRYEGRGGVEAKVVVWSAND